MHYVTKGTCSRAIDFDVVDGKVTNTKFTMGCMGNTQGVASLVEGMEVEEVIKRLKASTAEAEEHHVQISWQKHLNNT